MVFLDVPRVRVWRDELAECFNETLGDIRGLALVADDDHKRMARLEQLNERLCALSTAVEFFSVIVGRKQPEEPGE